MTEHKNYGIIEPYMEKTLTDKKLTKEQSFEILHEYLKKEKETSVRKCMDEVAFDKSSWSEFIAFQLGYQKALFKLDSFIPFTKGND